jgi:pimeloyl-ACP methyl ester carboxylesterase
MNELISICGTSNLERWGDVVFVHGLNGDARATWQPEGQPGRFWPSWLCEDLPNIGVWSVGYPVSSFGWKGSTMPLADRAISTLVLLESYGVGKEKPVIFITHSLGGLLVKEMLRKATDNSVPEGQQLAAHTRGVVFLSTPHSGSDLANFVAFLKFLLPTVSVDELRPQEPRLRELNTWYRNNVSRLGIETQVYCERKPTKAGQGWFKGRFEAMVVDANSSDPGITGVTAVPLDEDHISISHPVRDGVLYRRIKEFVSKGLSGTTKKSETAAVSTTTEENPGTVPQSEQSILQGENVGRDVNIRSIHQTGNNQNSGTSGVTIGENASDTIIITGSGNNIVTGAQQPKPKEQGSTSIKPDFNLSELGAGTRRKIERMQSEIAQLEKDHESTKKDWLLALDPATKNRLEERLEIIENSIDEKTKQIERIKSG